MLFDETKNDFLFNIVSPNIIFFCQTMQLCAAVCSYVPLRAAASAVVDHGHWFNDTISDVA
jgi:hypothetical protein